MRKCPRSHGTDGACVRASGGVPLGAGTESTATFLCPPHENRTRPCDGDSVVGGPGPSEHQAPQPGQDLPEASDGGVAQAGARWAQRQEVGSEPVGAGRRARVPPSGRHATVRGAPLRPPRHWPLPPSCTRAPACLSLTVRPKVTSDSRKQSVAPSILSRGQQMCSAGPLHDGRKLLTVLTVSTKMATRTGLPTRKRTLERKRRRLRVRGSVDSAGEAEEVSESQRAPIPETLRALLRERPVLTGKRTDLADQHLAASCFPLRPAATPSRRTDAEGRHRVEHGSHSASRAAWSRASWATGRSGAGRP